MRLIDADALDKMLADAQTECKRNGGNFRFGVLSNVRENIANVPTIPAIPVEWMIEQRDKEDSGTHFWWMYQAIVGKWQKEQEARM